MLTRACLLVSLFENPNALLLRSQAALQCTPTVSMDLHWKATMGEKDNATIPTVGQGRDRQ